MALIRRIFLVLILSLSSTALFGAAPSSVEKRDLHVAQTKFDMTFYAEAEKLSADFCRDHTNSTLLPEAFLLQGKARFEQSNYVGAAEMLLSHFNPRDPFADEYLYYLGFTQARRGQYREAADALEGYLQTSPPGTQRESIRRKVEELRQKAHKQSNFARSAAYH